MCRWGYMWTILWEYWDTLVRGSIRYDIKHMKRWGLCWFRPPRRTIALIQFIRDYRGNQIIKKEQLNFEITDEILVKKGSTRSIGSGLKSSGLLMWWRVSYTKIWCPVPSRGLVFIPHTTLISKLNLETMDLYGRIVS